MSDFDSTAGSGLLCAALFAFLFYLLHRKRPTSGCDGIDCGRDALISHDDTCRSMNQPVITQRVKMCLTHAWVKAKETGDLFNRETLICLKEMKEDATAVIIQPIIDACRIIQLAAKFLVLRHKLRNLEASLLKAQTSLGELLIEQRDLLGQQVDNILPEPSRSGKADCVFSGVAEAHNVFVANAKAKASPDDAHKNNQEAGSASPSADC